MNKKELLDKAVHELKGVLPSDGCVTYREIHDYICKRTDTGSFYPSSICSVSEFEKRARELGYINGYRWGVEYPTDGEKPTLPDDVIVEMRRINGSWHEDGEDELDQFHHRSFSAFKITDKRYKPADTGYLNACTVEHLAHTKTTDTTIEFESVKADGEFAFDALKQDPSDWYDYEPQKAMRLPPVGEKVDGFIGLVFSPFKCTFVGIDSEGRIVVEKLDGNLYRYMTNQINLRPLDWNRKAEAERKRVVDAAYNAIAKPTGIGVDKALYELYELGYLRMPVDKD